MKKISTILLACFASALFIQVNAQTVFGTSHLFQVGFFNSDNGIITGASANAFVTPDGGSYWEQGGFIESTWIRGLKILKGTNKAIAVGQWRTIAQTEDYGAGWTKMIEAEGTTHFMAVDVKNGTGIAVGEGGKIYRATGLFGITDISEAKTDSKIYIQNPVKEELYIDSDAAVLSVKVIDLSGKILCQSAASTVNVSNLVKGIYLVQIETIEGKTVKKIIKE